MRRTSTLLNSSVSPASSTWSMASRVVCAAFSVALIVVLGACSSSGDRLVVPTPDEREFVDMRLTCLHATSQSNVVLGGYLTKRDGTFEGVVLRTENGGDTWRRIGSETFKFGDLLVQWVHLNDALRGWVAGVRVVEGRTIPVVLRTTDGGGHWRESRVPQRREDIVDQVGSLEFTTDVDGTVEVRYFDDETGDILVNVFETRDGGKNWVIKDWTRPSDDSILDPGEVMVSVDEGFRLNTPLDNGTQILDFTGSAGEVWVPYSQFHLSQFADYY